MKVEQQAQLGARLLKAIGRRSSVEDVARALLQAPTQIRESDPTFANWLAGALRSPGNLAPFTWSASWAANGFPQVAIGHKLAASLMSTKVPVDVIGDIAMPWSAFLIQVPDGLLHLPDQRDPNIEQSIDFISVLDDPRGPVVVLRSRARDDFFVVQRAGSWAEGLGESDDEDVTVLPNAEDLNERQRRAVSLSWRFVVGVAIEMLDRTGVREPRPNKPKRGGRDSDEPRVQTFALTRDVVVDCREGVRGYLSGRRSGVPAVQTLVRGHWKRQAFGVGRSERRFVHIEAYWRGSEDAPIAVKKHVLRDKEPKGSA